MRKTLLGAAFAITALALSPARAAAEPILFDPDGAGPLAPIVISGLDWVEGNGIAVGADGTSTGGDAFTFYYQANLAVTTGTIYANNTGGAGTLDSFTVVLGFGETVLANTNPGGVGTLTFGFDPANPVNFFQIYANTTPGIDIEGTGFNTGTLILEGDVIPQGYLSGFTTTGTSCGNLDQGGILATAGDQYPTTDTICGSGHTDLNVAVSYVDPLFFQTLAAGSIINFSTSSANAVVPYNITDPSACFLASGLVGTPTASVTTAGNQCLGAGAFEGVSSVGPVNGFSGPNTMLQIDGSSSFTTAQVGVVPEPATLTLFGLGLVGAAALRRRQVRKNKN